MKNIMYISIILPVFLFTGCVQKQTEETKNQISDTGTEKATVDKELASQGAEKNTQYEFDKNESEIMWYSKKILVYTKHYGTVGVQDGFIEYSGIEPVGGEIIVDMTSIKDLDMDGKPSADMLEKHLKSSDFFDVEAYPISKFVITDIKKKSEAADGSTIYEVSGDLTIKDKTNNIMIEATVKETDEQIKMQSDFSIDRSKWDVKFGSGKFFKNLGDNLIDDIIEYKLELVAKK